MRTPRRSTVVLVVAAAALVVLVAALSSALSRSSGSAAQSTTPQPGVPISQPAPGFTLRDEQGKPVSLSSYRGKVVLLAFIDSKCASVCPLTTTAMVDAKRLLGAAGKQVQLLGIDANPEATRVSDVRGYSRAHGLLGSWHFLTGSLPQLKRVWHQYSVEAKLQNGGVAHTPAVFVIDQKGEIQRQYVTEMAYAGVKQLGQDLAKNASTLLPSHPKVVLTQSGRIPMVGPSSTVTLPRAGGGSVRLGPGSSPHLLLFFDTWDSLTTNLASHLETLNRYQSAATAGGQLPQLIAVDEASVERSPSALPQFLAHLGQPLSYPVALDRSGAVADGYRVQDEPWIELVSASGKFLWYRDVGASSWPSLSKLKSKIRSALAHAKQSPGSGSGVPASSSSPLAAVYAQANQLLGTEPALMARIKALRGYPIVINAWASWCSPCRQEFPLLASAAKRYGDKVAFLGANTNDSTANAHSFLSHHPVGYPSYQATTGNLSSLAVIEGLPTTIYVAPNGKVAFVHTGQYASQQSLDSDIQRYALSSVQ